MLRWKNPIVLTISLKWSYDNRDLRGVEVAGKLGCLGQVYVMAVTATS